jgi:8-oxo-dGTP pyrophosphatase MutT (NUDIX family)
VVVNEESCLLMIFRNGKWDLPKGKIEKGEEADEAAIREVYEECGVGEMELQKQLATTFHTYPFKDVKVLKKTFWFLMKSSDHSKLIPQLEEGITEVRWMNKREVQQVIPQTYSSISALINEQVLDDSFSLLG